MNPKEHRIYQYLSEPLIIIGMTLDELALGIVGVIGSLMINSLTLKSLFFLVGVGGVYIIKKFKKMTSGFSLGSFLHWYFGMMAGRSPSWPASWKRFWLS